ncbi:MAG: hypothetical protein JW888_02820, partial [Pirellulales bacterium]|nr:hypothetical protein [Pirellulales bacterium]
MQVFLIVAIVATLFIAENVPASPIAGHVGVRLLSAALGMASVPLLATAVSKMISRRLRAGGANVRRLSRLYRCLRHAHVIVWL